MLTKPIMDTTINTRLNRSFGAFGSFIWWGNFRISGPDKDSFLDTLAISSIGAGKSPKQPKPIKPKLTNTHKVYHGNNPSWSLFHSHSTNVSKTVKVVLLYLQKYVIKKCQTFNPVGENNYYCSPSSGCPLAQVLTRIFKIPVSYCLYIRLIRFGIQFGKHPVGKYVKSTLKQKKTGLT